jgi:signal transduction histidine kinase/DNA-binding response OmpR family regulator/CHASE3 domain sensor protein
MKSTLKRNLLYGLGLSLVLLFISSFASYISIRNLIESSDMVRKSNQIIEDLNDVLSVVKDAETGQRGFLLTADTVFLAPYNEAAARTSGIMNSLSSEITNTDIQQKNLAQLRYDIENRMRILDQNINEKKTHGTVSTDVFLSGKKYMDDLRVVIADMQHEEQQILQSRTASLNRLSNFTPSLIIFSALLAIAITLFFYRKVSSDLDEKNELQEELEQKNEEMEKRIIAIQNVAAQISDGDYKIRLDKITKDGLGSLAGSLNNMAQSLQHSFNLLEEKEWLQSGIALLNDSMVGEKSVETLAKDILENITEHSASRVAAIYILEDDNQLHLAASYALAENEKKKTLKTGEGIAGQAFQSGKQILLQNIPDNDSTITYATGKTKPRNVVAVPVTRDKMVIGVIELGALHDYSPLQLEFLKSISGNIGLAFYGAQNRKRLQELLEETQAQTEELQTQHSELESINAELEAQTEKVQASEEELRVQQEELLQSNQELEERTTLLEEKNKLIEERNRDIQQKSKELEQSTKYKSEFLANMSHELRTPLNSILLLSRLMSESKDLDKQYIEYAEVMQSSGQGLLSLIDEILDLSKIEAGKMTLEIADFSLEEIASDMKSLFFPIAKEKKLELKINIADNTTETLHTDKMRLEQILRNLLSNALKFTSQGQVSLDISNDSSDKKIFFKVTDTGIGIAKDKLSLVFEAFQQADGSTRRKFGGTGLGLSISRELARLLGGEIEVTSTEGVGSEFILTLPVDINKKAELEAKPVKEKNNYQAGETAEQQKRFIVDHIPQPIDDDRNNIVEGDKVILIIEDDTSFAKILLDYSRKKNYKGIVAVRGDVGIEMAEHFKPLAVLLDIQLPVMDGWQVMEALKSNPETMPIPVHIMSSLKFKQESLLRGAVDFINKPFALEQMQQMFKKLEDALSRSPKKVLIVEENKQHAKALSYFLSANNINTQIANNVSESIEVLQKHEIDCVILDMGVPDKNAYHTLDTIKENKGLENLPIIVFTGKNLSKGEENRIKKYADSIVVKTAYSYQRILDEAGLFLHLVEEKNKKSVERGTAFESVNEMRNILKGKTVLIADDDVRNIFSLTKALELHNMKVLAALDGKEALKTLNDNPGVDVVLMDMMMPEMDGYETIREIRAMNQFKNIPILAVTAKAMMGDREKCIAVGASDYISKPVDIDQLISLLRVWLYDKI